MYKNNIFVQNLFTSIPFTPTIAIKQQSYPTVPPSHLPKTTELHPSASPPAGSALWLCDPDHGRVLDHRSRAPRRHGPGARVRLPSARGPVHVLRLPRLHEGHERHVHGRPHHGGGRGALQPTQAHRPLCHAARG